jgi:hypothetical protein
MKGIINPKDEIDVLDENNGLYGRIRVREHSRDGGRKASIFLTPDQLEEHAAACIALAENMKDRR